MDGQSGRETVSELYFSKREARCESCHSAHLSWSREYVICQDCGTPYRRTTLRSLDVAAYDAERQAEMDRIAPRWRA